MEHPKSAKLAWRWNYNLKQEVTLLLLSGLLVGGLLMLLVLIPVFNQFVVTEKKSNIQTFEKFFNLGLAYPLYTVDEEQISAFVDASEANPRISQLKVFDDSNQLIAEYTDQHLLEIPERFLSSIEIDIYYQNVPVGHAKLILNSINLQRQAMLFTGAIILVVFLSMTGGAMLLHRYLKERILNPMQELINSSTSVSEGKFTHLNFSNKLPTDWQTVKSAFDFMTDALRAHSEHLEELVSERTKERDMNRMKALESARLAAVGEMSAGIAHEINNPLAVILGQAQILKKTLEQENLLTPQKASGLEKIERMILRITRIIKNLKSFSRQGDKDPFELCSINKIIEDTLDFCGIRMKNLSIEFSILSPGKDVTFLGREIQISQVVLNLINNSIDAISNNPGPNWIRVEIKPLEDILRVRFIDSGNGIPAPVRAKLMQPFFTTKEVGKGTGLGLSLSKGIIEQHHGQLYYDETSENTCFVIELPINSSK